MRSYPERGGVGNAYRQVGKDSQQPIGKRRLEGQVVRDLMDGQEEVLVGGRADDVGRNESLP